MPRIPVSRPLLLAPALAAVSATFGCGGGGGGGGDEVDVPPIRPPVGAEQVFSKDRLLTYTVTITQSNLDWIEEHGVDEEWQPTERVVVSGGEGGDEVLLDVGFRHKGGYGTLESCSSDPQDLDGNPNVETYEEFLTRERDWYSS